VQGAGRREGLFPLQGLRPAGSAPTPSRGQALGVQRSNRVFNGFPSGETKAAIWGVTLS